MRRSGQIIAKDKGRWRVRWYRGTDEATGRKRYASETVHGTKRDAERRLAEILGKVERGVTVTTAGVTVGEMLERWMADPAAQHHRRARTIKNYRDVMDRHIVPRLGSVRVDRLDPATLRTRLVHPLLEAGKKRTAQHARDVLSVALEWAAESKRYGIDSNPIRGTVRIRGTGGPAPGSLASRALTHQQVADFRGAIQGDRHELLLLMMLVTGMRPSEALALQWRDIAWSTEDRRQWAGDTEADLARSAANGEGPCLLVRRALIPRDKVPWVNGEPVFAPPKTAAGLRVIPLPSEIVRRLREHRAGQAGQRLLQRLRRYDYGLVFVGRSGQPLSLTSLRNNHFKPALRRAELPGSVRLYDLRHTAATHAVMHALGNGGGEMLTSVSRWIGHASLKMTLDTYTHATEDGTRALSDAVAGALLGD